MELSDLFVNYKAVDPVVFTLDTPELPKSLYINLERAQKAASEDAPQTDVLETDDVSGWKVQGSDELDWQVGTSTKGTPSTTPIAASIAAPKGTSWKNPYKSNRKQWVTDMTAAYKRHGLSDNAIKNLIAKNALESGWGKSAQGAFNFGNITTGSKWTGDYVDGKDKDANGNPITNRFRAYNSLDDYVKDEIQFLTSLYDFKDNDDFDTFIGKLLGNNSGKRRYAEDREYAKKVRGVYNSI